MLRISNQLNRILLSLPKNVQSDLMHFPFDFYRVHAKETEGQTAHFGRTQKMKLSLRKKNFRTINYHYLFKNCEHMLNMALEEPKKDNLEIYYKLDKEDLFYLLRIFCYSKGGGEDGEQMFNRYLVEELEEILLTNPLKKDNFYQGLLLHFRADLDKFEIDKDITIRRLYPWEYTDRVLDILNMRNLIRLPFPETLADANFVVEIYSESLPADEENYHIWDNWEEVEKIRQIVDIIAVAAKGHVWAPVLTIKSLSEQGIKGADFRGYIGIVPYEESNQFIKRVRKALKLRTKNVFKSVFRSLRQEEEESGFVFRVLRLYSALEKLVGAQGKHCGFVLAWFLGKNANARKKYFDEFLTIKKFRDEIAHRALIKDIMEIPDRVIIFNSYRKLESWLFALCSDFLSQDHTHKEWKEQLNKKIFG